MAQILRLILPALLLTLFRLYPHPWNFSPVLALFAYASLRNRPALIPLALALIVSDLVIGFDATVVLGYVAYAVIALLPALRSLKWPLFVGSGSVLFFLVSNLGVWALSGLYPTNQEGLIQCFTMALPFFRNSLMGDFFYAFLFFELFAYLRRWALSNRTLRVGA